MYQICSKREGWISEFRDTENKNKASNLHHRRALFDREVEHMGEMLEILESARATEGEDKILWKATKDSIFTVKNRNNIIIKSRNQAQFRIDWQAKKFWSAEIPARICFFFMWETLTGAIFIKERLYIIFPEVDTSCSLCNFA